MNTKHCAYGRLSSYEDWRPITMGGQMFYADLPTLTGLVQQMQSRNPHIEYKIEEAK